MILRESFPSSHPESITCRYKEPRPCTMKDAMKLARLTTICLIIVTAGCASRRTPSLSEDQFRYSETEAHVLVSEIDLLVRSIAKLRQEPSVAQKSKPEDRTRDLNREIAILHEARDRLSSEEKRLRTRYNVWDRW